MLKCSKLVLWSCLIFLPVISWGQDYTQTIRGKVVEEISGAPIEGAEVTIQELKKGVVTGADGKFRIEEVPAGRYSLEATHPDHAPYSMSGLVVVSGKELRHDIEMEAKSFDLKQVEIVEFIRLAPKNVSTRFLTVEETKRFASVYWDPARLAASFPGVIQSNDQSNHLIIRGNGPAALQWRMEGAEIVAPNHLNNAGTFSDRPTFSGGGTSMLSTQLMGHSLFSTGAFPSTYGNALGGIFDVGLRKGNNERFEFTAQAGLIGIDLSAEGPLSKSRRGSFLFNYRYSTIGLLALMGVPLGDERINYQDFAFNLHLPTQRGGEFSLFGLMGNSITEFDHSEDSLVTEQKELFDIRYRSNTQVLGAKHRISLGERSNLATVAAYSNTNSNRTATLFADSIPAGWDLEFDELSRGILSLNSTLNSQLTSRLRLTTGLSASRRDYSQVTRQNNLDSIFVARILNAGEWASWMGQAFGAVEVQLNDKLELNAGLHGLYYERTGDLSVEPRVSLTHRSGSRHRMQFAYGRHSQEQYPGYYTVRGMGEEPSEQPNANLGLTRAHHYVASYRYRFSHASYLQIEPYIQDISNVALVPDPMRPLSGLNQLEPSLLDSMSNTGKGLNYGLEMTVERNLSRNFYYLLSGSLYESQYEAADGVWRDSRWAGKYALSANAGWEKRRESRKGKQQVFGFNIRAIQRGGLRALPIDLAASRAIGRTAWNVSEGYSVQLPDYRRLDFRFTYQRNRRGFVSTFALDIQNLLNTSNVAFYYYDVVADAILTKNQLGIIPVMSYRIEF